MTRPDPRPGGAAGPVLVLRSLGLGDLLTAAPALRAVARTWPDADLVLATSAWVEPLVPFIAPFRVLPSHALEPLDWTGPPPSVAVNLHGRGPLSHEVLTALRPGRLIAFAPPADIDPGPSPLFADRAPSSAADSAGSGGKGPERGSADRPGARPGRRSGIGPQWRADEHEVDRWCRMLGWYGIAADRRDLALDVAPDVRAAGRDTVVVHPGASSASRRWPVERWAEVARVAAADGRPVLVTGSVDERRLTASVVAAADLPPGSDAGGRWTVEGLAAVVAAAGLVCCGDTGVSHLATAVGTPSVTLFGPVSPALWGPPADDPTHVALWKGRTGNPHDSRTDPGLLAIGVDEVLGAMGRALRASAVGAVRRPPAPPQVRERGQRVAVCGGAA